MPFQSCRIARLGKKRSDMTTDLRREVAQLEPWITGFTVDGQNYGGQYFAETDPRAHDFVARAKSSGRSMKTILECGCLEGGHTSVLASSFPEATVTALDVRADNIAKAQLLTRVRGLKNVRFVLDDLEEPKTAFASAYDAIFCVGLLYHLRDPALFLKRCGEAAPLLWLWTVYCAETEAELIEGKARGRLYAEPTAHPLSAVRNESFFPTLGSLIEMAMAAGYRSVDVLKLEMTLNNNGPAVLLCAHR